MATPILAIQTADKLLQLARQRTYEASGGILNDTSDAGVVSALLKAQVAALADQNTLLNSLVDVAVLSLLAAMGIAVSPGTPAIVTVVLVLNQTPSTNVIIPRFKIARSGISFYTANRVEVVAGQGTIRTSAIATVYGVAGNVSAGQGLILEPQPLVQSVVFEEVTTPGTDPESLDTIPPQTLIDRLAAGCLTRTTDFEREMRNALGKGSVALALGKLSDDRQTQELGAVHVFGLNPDGSELTSAQLQTAQQSLNSGSPLATIYVSSMEIVELQAGVILVLESNADGAIVSSAIWESFKAYVQPQSLPPGEPVYVNQLVVLAGKTTGVNRIQSVTLGELPGTLEPGNQLLPFKWSVPRLDKLVVTCVFGANSTAFTYARTV